MTIPLMILAVGAVSAGWLGIPEVVGGGNWIADFFKPVLGHPHVGAGHSEEWMVMGISVLCGIGGIALAWFFYSLKPEIPKNLAVSFKGVYTVLWNKYYIDELYDLIIVRPAMWVSNNVLIAVTDGKIIEGVVNGIPRAIGAFSARLRKIQTGYVQHYAISMAIGLFVILTLALIAAGR